MAATAIPTIETRRRRLWPLTESDVADWARLIHADPQISRLIGFVVPEHVASRRVLERLGFVYECDTHFGGVDLVRYGLKPEQFHGLARHDE